MKDIHYFRAEETAKIVSKVNPYMKDKSVDWILSNMIETVSRTIKTGNSCYVATGGWLAIIEECDDVYFVEFYIPIHLLANSSFFIENIQTPK